MKLVFLIFPFVFFLFSCTTKIPSNTIITTESGLNYRDIKYGSGKVVKLGDKIKVHFLVKTSDSTEIENTWKSNRPFIFTIGKSEAIKGIEQGVIGLSKGAQRELFIPGELAFYDDKYSTKAYNGTIYVLIELIDILDN